MKSITLAIILAAVASAQTIVNATSSGSGPNFTASATFQPNQFVQPAITGAAYSGEQISEHVQTLEDGTKITRKQLQRKIWRDSQGRTRTEHPLMMNPNVPNQPMIVEINDPVAHVQWVLDSQNKVAHRMTESANRVGGGVTMARSGVMGGVISAVGAPMPIFNAAGQQVSMQASMVSPPPQPAGQNQARPKFTTESLGTKIIDGVLVEGTRTTMTFVAGSVGNDRDFSSTSETWSAPNLKLQVLSISRDPRSGVSTFQIANLSRDQPDPSLFLPPADYQIVDEKDQFTITFKGQ